MRACPHCGNFKTYNVRSFELRCLDDPIEALLGFYLLFIPIIVWIVKFIKVLSIPGNLYRCKSCGYQWFEE